MADSTGTRQRARGIRQLLAWAGAHPLLCATVFFCFTFALRLMLSSRLEPILLFNRPDEYRYLHLARSIAEGGPLLIQGLPAQFQKIFQSLLISPAFLLARDPVAQVKLIGVINNLLMASMMFPLALLAKKLSRKPAVLLLTLSFAAALPDFIFTATLMTETLYWPLCIWVFYFFHRAMAEPSPRKRLLLFGVFGSFTWLTYLTKEQGAAFLIAGAVVLIYEGIRGRRLAQNGLALAVSLVAFFVPYIIVRQTLFPGVANSYAGSNGHADYDHLGLSVLRDPGALLYMLYFAAVLFAAAILSFYILPVLLPLFRFERLGTEKQRMYLFSMASLVITVGAMAFAIREPDWWGEPRPRLHLRLLAPIVAPFVILCFDLLLSREKKKSRGQQSVLVITAAVCALTVILLPGVPKYDNWIDRASMFVSHLAPMLTRNGMDRGFANLLWQAWLALMLALTVAGVICFVRGKRKPVLVMLLCAIFALSAIDNVFNYSATATIKTQHVSEAAIRKRAEGKPFAFVMDNIFAAQPPQNADILAPAAAAVSDYLRQVDGPDGDIVVCVKLPKKLFIETYFSQHLRPLFLEAPDLEDYLAAGGREYAHADNSNTKELRVNYIVVTEDFNPFANVELAFAAPPFLVLRNLDPARYVFS